MGGGLTRWFVPLGHICFKVNLVFYFHAPGSNDWGHIVFVLSVFIPPANEVWGVYRNHPVCLSVRLFVCSSVQSKLNLDHNFLTKWDKALILHKCISCDKTFLSIPKFLTSWPWPWLLTYFWKNLTLAITFEPKEIGLSYFICVFLVTRPFCRYQNIWLHDLDLDFWPTFEKT